MFFLRIWLTKSMMSFLFSLDELQVAPKALHDVLKYDLPGMQKEKPKTASSNASDTCDRCGRNLDEIRDKNN